MRPDQKVAIKLIVEEVGKRAGCPKAAASGSSSTVLWGRVPLMWVVERAIQSVQGGARVMRLAIEKRLGAELSVDTPLLDSLVEFSDVLNMCEMGHDGKTASDRLEGESAHVVGRTRRGCPLEG